MLSVKSHKYMLSLGGIYFSVDFTGNIIKKRTEKNVKAQLRSFFFIFEQRSVTFDMLLNSIDGYKRFSESSSRLCWNSM